MSRQWPYSAGQTIRAVNDNEDKDGLATGENDYPSNSLALFRDEAFVNFFAPGGVIWTITSGLTATMSAGAMYYDGQRIPINAVGSKSFAANTTNYVDVGTDGVVDYDTDPTLEAGHMRIAVITTGASAITSIVQSGYDSSNNQIHNISPVLNNSIPNVQKVATAATSITPNIAYEMLSITALANNLTINAPSGAPAEGQAMVVKIRDNGTNRTLTWAAGWVGIGVTLPVQTGGNKTVYVAARYSESPARWEVLAVGRE